MARRRALACTKSGAAGCRRCDRRRGTPARSRGAATGTDLTGNNPGAENIRGGLSSIEEKSLGAIAKGGSRRIAGLLAVAEAPPGPGVYVMDAPGFSPESMTGFAAGGAQVMLFTTGA